MNIRRSQSGNILVYILGAIFLMGLLLVLVKGSSNPGGGIDAENMVIKVSDAQRYTNEIERAIGIILQNGASEADIRFSHPNGASAYGTTLTAPLTRQVFDPLGGAAEYRLPPVGVNDGTRWQFFANTHIAYQGANSSSEMKAELLMVLPNVTEAFCNRVNQIAGQTDIVLVPAAANYQDPSANGCIYDPASTYNGTYLKGSSTNTLDITKFNFDTPPADACIRCESGNLHYYHILLAR
jgi:hypothetical protein